MAAALLAAVLFGVIATVQASAIRRQGLFSPTMALVAVGYVVGWLLHLVAIAYLPLYLAQVGVGASLVVTALLASEILGEPLRAYQWSAVAAMAGGLAVLALAAGDVGDSDFTGTTTVALYALFGVTSVLGVLCWRWRHPVTGPLLGILSGVAYGASPVATRALVDFRWDLVALATAASIGLFGLLGFLVYSLALNRTTVAAATAPQVLLQTLIPAAVGIVVFDDGVRSGWWPAALTAFAVAVASGILLAGAGARLDLREDGLVSTAGDELDELLS